MRSFSKALVAVVVPLLISCAGRAPVTDVAEPLTPNGAETPVAGRDDYPARIIDAHSHWFDEGLDQPQAKMVDMYRDAGVTGAVVHCSKTQAPPGVIDRAGPVGLAVCAAVVPPVTPLAVEKDIKAGKYQCLKVYLGYIAKWASDPYYKKFYELAGKYNIPVVFHTGDTADKMVPVKYADPLTVDEIAIQYPHNTFVIAHIGNPWIQSAAEVIYKNDNVYADVSALMLGDVSKQSPEAVNELIVKPLRWVSIFVENPNKLMFGSDTPLVDVRSYVSAVKQAIPREHWDAFFYKNAQRVFKLGQPRGGDLASKGIL